MNTKNNTVNVDTEEELSTQQQLDTLGKINFKEFKTSIDYAIAYAQMGLPVVRCHEPIFNDAGECIGCTCEKYMRSDKYRISLQAAGEEEDFDPNYKCPSPGKHPITSYYSATTDIDEIKSWAKYNKNPNIGIFLKGIHKVAIDQDSYKPNFDNAGIKDALEFDTVIGNTGGAGQHIVYDLPEGFVIKSNKKKLNISGVDILVNAMIMVPPSKHKSGGNYQWEDGHSPFEIAFKPLPEKLLNELSIADTDDDESDKPAQQKVYSAIDKELVHQAVLSLDCASLSYDEWLSVYIALTTVFDDSDVLAIMKEWGKFTSKDARKIKSFDRKRHDVTVGTIFYLAKEYGRDENGKPFDPIATRLDLNFNSESAKAFRNKMETLSKTKQQTEGATPTTDTSSVDNTTVGTSDSLPQLVINERQMRYVISDTLSAMTKAVNKDITNSPFYVRNKKLVRIQKDEQTNDLVASEFTPSSLISELANVADWVKSKQEKNSTIFVNVFPDKDISNAIYNLGKWDDIPFLADIITHPTFSKDGILQTEAGYNPQTKLYYTGGVTVGNTEPTAENVAWAKSMILDEVLVDFPFKDEASKAHAVAYMLVPFVRRMITGLVPPTIMDAPSQGTGKGLLLSVCTLPALGKPVPTTAYITDNDVEWKKMITSTLLNGHTHCAIDNIDTTITSAVLASAWTASIWDDRTLGKNTKVNLPNLLIWGLSANNVQLNFDIARRLVWIRLDANVERPWTRNGFRHENLQEWVTENRDDIVTAIIILINAWIAAGKPLFRDKVKGSFESWSKIMGGILSVAGINGFLENEDELLTQSVEDNDGLVDFILTWWEKYGDQEVSQPKLFPLASYPDNPDNNSTGEYKNLLGDMLHSPKQRGRETQLGGKLKENTDKVIRGFKILKRVRKQGAQYWKLQDCRTEEEKHNDGNTVYSFKLNDQTIDFMADDQQP